MKQFQIVAIIQSDVLKVTSDGTPEGTVFEGPEGMGNQAYNAAYLGLRVPLGDGDNDAIVKAGFDTPLGLTAAIYSIAPQHVHLWRAPQEVLDTVTSHGDDRHGEFTLVSDD